MTLLDVMGQFWLATNPDRKVPGRLVVDEMNDAKLELLGGLLDWKRSIDLQDQLLRILGTVDGHDITLDRCFMIGIPNPIKSRYFCPIVLDGMHFSEKDGMMFNSVRLKLHHLNEWVWMSGIRYADSANIELSYTPVQKMKRNVGVGEIEIGFDVNYSGEMVGIRTIGEDCTLRIEFNQRKTAEEILRLCTEFQDLVTMCTGESSALTSIEVQHKKNGNLLRIHTRRRAKETSRAKKIYPNQMILNFRDICGIDGVSAWMENAQKFFPVMVPLRSYWHTPDLDVETEFVNLVMAAEALGRIIFNVEGISFRERIELLATNVSDIITPFVDDKHIWANKIRDTRKNLFHNIAIHSGIETRPSFGELLFLSDSLYFLIVLCLLQECGIPDEKLLNVDARFRKYFG